MEMRCASKMMSLRLCFDPRSDLSNVQILFNLCFFSMTPAAKKNCHDSRCNDGSNPKDFLQNGTSRNMRPAVKTGAVAKVRKR